MNSALDLDRALEVAIEAAKAGGDVLVEQYRKIFESGEKSDLTISTKSSEIDFVTEVDVLAQEAIISAIQKHFPDHRFIAEEEGWGKNHV